MTTDRKRKKSVKYHGTRLHGRGDSKHGRGTGCKGGWGRAGMHKHRFSYATTYERDWVKYGGRRGFSNPNAKKLKTVNVFHIENLAKKGKLKDVFEFKGKVLGVGELTHTIDVKAYAATPKAIEKIERAGGNFTQLGGQEEEKQAE